MVVRLGRGGTEGCWLRGTEFQFCKMKKFWRLVTQQYECMCMCVCVCIYIYIYIYIIKTSNRNSRCGAAETNPTGNHEVAGSNPGLARRVKDLVLL